MQSRFTDVWIIAILGEYRGVRRLVGAQQPRQILLILLSITFFFDSRSYGIVGRVCLARLLMRRERHISVATIIGLRALAASRARAPRLHHNGTLSNPAISFCNVMVPDLAKPATS